MNRRNLLVGLISMPMASVGANAALYDNNWNTVQNKLGLNVHYSKAMAADLWTIHGLDIEKVIPHMYGTEFKLETLTHNNIKINNYVKFFTNSSKDGIQSWGTDRKYHDERATFIIKSMKRTQSFT